MKIRIIDGEVIAYTGEGNLIGTVDMTDLVTVEAMKIACGYHEMLTKYARHVYDEESITFLSPGRMDHCKTEFTLQERAELNAIYEEVELG